MATKKKTDTSSKAKSSKKAKAPAKKKTATKTAKKGPKPEPVKVGARHPKARVLEAHGTKEALAKSLAEVIAREDEDTDLIADRLRTASNSQLLRLRQAADTVKEKYGDRTKLIAAIAGAQNKSKDKDYVAKLSTFSSGRLVDMLNSAKTRNARKARKSGAAPKAKAKSSAAPQAAAAKAKRAPAKKPAAK